MYRTNHGVAADYYATGVIGYELMIGRVFIIIISIIIIKFSMKEAIFRKKS